MEQMVRQAGEWGLALGDEQVDSLERYARLLAGYERANVIGTRDFEKVVLDHLLDSLSCLLYEPLRRARSIADIGSGAGLPGIPISIARPGAALTLIEATRKKTDFLGYAVERLALERIRVLNERVEDVAHSGEHRSRYHAATARAVDRLSVLVEYGVPLLRVNGSMVAMKARLDAGELEEGRRAARLLGAEVSGVIPVPFLPDIRDVQRRLVVVTRVGETPRRYPRKPGIPRKQPLGARD
jgi:16S rRNA (guanine527-N7)-methyltransferase